MSNPTTGEWTEEWLETLFEKNFKGDTVKAILDAHNAALTAERDKYIDQREDWIREIQQLKDQLSAEGEKSKIEGLYEGRDYERKLINEEQKERKP